MCFACVFMETAVLSRYITALEWYKTRQGELVRLSILDLHVFSYWGELRNVHIAWWEEKKTEGGKFLVLPLF